MTSSTSSIKACSSGGTRWACPNVPVKQGWGSNRSSPPPPSKQPIGAHRRSCGSASAQREITAPFFSGTASSRTSDSLSSRPTWRGTTCRGMRPWRSCAKSSSSTPPIPSDSSNRTWTGSAGEHPRLSVAMPAQRPGGHTALGRSDAADTSTHQHQPRDSGDDDKNSATVSDGPRLQLQHGRLGFRRHQQIADERDLDENKDDDGEQHDRAELGADCGS